MFTGTWSETHDLWTIEESQERQRSYRRLKNEKNFSDKHSVDNQSNPKERRCGFNGLTEEVWNLGDDQLTRSWQNNLEHKGLIWVGAWLKIRTSSESKRALSVTVTTPPKDIRRLQCLLQHYLICKKWNLQTHNKMMHTFSNSWLAQLSQSRE